MSSNYWERRAEESVKRYERAVNNRLKEMVAAFEQAKKDLTAQIYAFYGRYANNNEITLAEAKKALSRKELAEFKGNLAEFEALARNSIGTFNLELENISTKVRLTRLDALLVQVDATLQELYQQQRESINRTVEDVAVEEYYHTQYDISKSTERVFAFAQLPKGFVEQVLAEPVEGLDISSRLWRQDADVGFKIRQTLNRMFTEGRPPQDFAEELGKMIGAVQVDKDGNVTGSGKKYEAYRLLYNESAYATGQARLQTYLETGVPYYEITATLDTRTTPTCRSLDGCIFSATRGGDVPEQYKKAGSEYQRAAYDTNRVIVGMNYPPFHVNCRTVATPYYEDTDLSMMTRAARDADGNPITVPADMTYREWYKKYIKDRQ